MYGGIVVLTNFQYQVIDGEGQRALPNGQPSGQKIAVKFLTFREINNPMTIQMMFTPEELEQFIAFISGNKIIPARDIPRFTVIPPGNGSAQKL